MDTKSDIKQARNFILLYLCAKCWKGLYYCIKSDTIISDTKRYDLFEKWIGGINMGDVTGNKGVLVLALCALAIVSFAGAFMEIGLF